MSYTAQAARFYLTTSSCLPALTQARAYYDFMSYPDTDEELGGGSEDGAGGSEDAATQDMLEDETVDDAPARCNAMPPSLDNQQQQQQAVFCGAVQAEADTDLDLEVLAMSRQAGSDEAVLVEGQQDGRSSAVSTESEVDPNAQPDASMLYGASISTLAEVAEEERDVQMGGGGSTAAGTDVAAMEVVVCGSAAFGTSADVIAADSLGMAVSEGGDLSSGDTKVPAAIQNMPEGG